VTRVACARQETSEHGPEGPVHGPTSVPLLVIDFDGTITERDTLDLIVHEFGDPEVRLRTERELSKTLTLHEVIARQYESVQRPLLEVLEWAAQHVRFRPGFHEMIGFAGSRGWPVIIVSSGVREVIEHLLAREGLEVASLVANSVAADTAGWRVRFHVQQACDVCGEPCKRQTVEALRGRHRLIYVGDGYSDGCAALAADRVFARRRLAAYLEERGVPFEPFEDFFQIIEALRGSA
jgi:2-hydroxy-3-keto-5-methylthiopentenyl-1-phosphate phosphatase